MDKFKDIRPYQDDEIRPVIDKLMADQDMLLSIARFYAPRLSRLFPGLMLVLARRRLRKQVVGVKDVKTMQDVIAVYMEKMIKDTTNGLTQSGLDRLDPQRSYVFISNHRDIAMDPALVNYVLYHGGFETLQIAIGDNLLKKPFVTDLMRLNKSFIVKRSLKGRELLQSLFLLSEYIHHCIQIGENVWIAQREGRAKDGNDRTDPALLKMLAMGRRDLGLGGSLAQLHIVPVAISYEYDACDVFKAEELFQLATTGSFTKTDQSDIQSIVQGVIGYKGKVHIAFGSELELASDDPDVIAAEIDRQIIANYRLHDSNYLAFEKLANTGCLPDDAPQLDSGNVAPGRQARQEFEERMATVDSKLHETWLHSYANPVINSIRARGCSE
ncbi:MAG: 1-acyl-sn-glycerol-3-phosphate acyltransferase [Gammaproteobacteria bacterium]